MFVTAETFFHHNLVTSECVKAVTHPLIIVHCTSVEIFLVSEICDDPETRSRSKFSSLEQCYRIAHTEFQCGFSTVRPAVYFRIGRSSIFQNIMSCSRQVIFLIYIKMIMHELFPVKCAGRATGFSCPTQLNDDSAAHPCSTPP